MKGETQRSLPWVPEFSKLILEPVDENRKDNWEGSLEGKTCLGMGLQTSSQELFSSKAALASKKNVVIKHRAGRTLSFSHGTASSASPRARTQCLGEIWIYALHTHLSSCWSSSVPRGSLMSPVLAQGRALSCTFHRLRPQHWAGEEICPRSMWNLAEQEPETLQTPTQCLLFVALTSFCEGEQRNPSFKAQIGDSHRHSLTGPRISFIMQRR